MLTLSVAHVAMAGLVVGLLYQIGSVVSSYIDDRVAVAVCVGLAAVGAVFDIRAIRNDSYAPGLRRQTSKALAQRDDLPQWVAPMIWGLDTGTMWTTFRVSASTWVVMIAALLHVAPQWSGLVFGAAFTIPLSLAVIAGRGDVTELGGPGSRRVVQAMTVTVALLPAAVLAGSMAM
ncbi:hypothetical protein [Actinoplanes flavus]|uniref:Uncharacterized protein n=1 Tax=Actinoplanes flavus TaxID=2820290 RepID=A0ABS3USC6_9ACTN|nr:hypothetical protein [Actinoplanes flavus]MBO3741482.1 hypothetical protein [Actinoplanes flavus]